MPRAFVAIIRAQAVDNQDKITTGRADEERTALRAKMQALHRTVQKKVCLNPL